jgi:hypothetical protein
MWMLYGAARWAVDQVYLGQGVMAASLALASRGCPEFWKHDNVSWRANSAW